MLEQNRIKCATILERLLAATAVPFDDNLESHLPVEHGLYVITRQNGSGRVECLHAGATGCQRRLKPSKTGRKGLRCRISGDHFCGGGKDARSDLVQKVIDNLHTQLNIPSGPANRKTRSAAKGWSRENCLVQCLVEQDRDLRCW